jgi:hypothetical protein
MAAPLMVGGYDPALGDEAARAARADLERGELAAALALVDGAPPERQAFALLLLADPAGAVAPWLDQLVAAGGSAHVAGLAAMRHWWRTTALEGQDDEYGPTSYRNAVLSARALATLAPADRPPWFSTVALAVESDLGHAVPARVARHRAIVAERPVDPLAWLVHLRGVPFDDAVADIEKASDGAPRGSILHALRLVPHVERWRTLAEPERSAYFQWPVVSDVVRAASAAFGTGDGGPVGRFGHGILAFCAFRTAKPATVRPHLAALQGQWTFWPWGVLRRPRDAFVEVADKYEPSSGPWFPRLRRR